jgi:phosphoribosylformylglycinamidine synthase
MTVPQRKVGGNIGIDIDCSVIAPGLRADTVLWSETGGFIVEVDADKVSAFEALAKKHALEPILIGETTRKPLLSIRRSGTTLIEQSLEALRLPWSEALERALKSS